VGAEVPEREKEASSKIDDDMVSKSVKPLKEAIDVDSDAIRSDQEPRVESWGGTMRYFRGRKRKRGERKSRGL
jgi:hypothetical protein